MGNVSKKDQNMKGIITLSIFTRWFFNRTLSINETKTVTNKEIKLERWKDRPKEINKSRKTRNGKNTRTNFQGKET